MTMPKFKPIASRMKVLARANELAANSNFHITGFDWHKTGNVIQAIFEEFNSQLTEAYEAGKRDAIPEGLLESVAKAIYAQWRDNPKYVAWVEGGNSIRQDSARSIAKSAIEAAAPKGEE